MTEEAERREAERMVRMTEQAAAWTRWYEMREKQEEKRKEKEKENEGEDTENRATIVLPIKQATTVLPMDWDGPRLLAMIE